MARSVIDLNKFLHDLVSFGESFSGIFRMSLCLDLSHVSRDEVEAVLCS